MAIYFCPLFALALAFPLALAFSSSHLSLPSLFEK
jgi:hypothetical protein